LIAALEFNPYTGVWLGQTVESNTLTGIGNTRHSPDLQRAKESRDLNPQPPTVRRVRIVRDKAPVFAEVVAPDPVE
jgi:hypothetical protein